MDGVSNVLRRMNSAASSKDTARNEVVSISDATDLVDRTVRMKRELAALGEQYNETESELIERARTVYESYRKKGSYTSSVTCVGKTTDGLVVIFADKFSPLPVEMEKDLRKLDPRYDDHFCEVRDIKLKSDATDADIETIIKALGEDNFKRLFDVSIKIGTRKGLARVYETLTAKVKGLLRQAKPSVRELNAEGKS